MPRDTRTPNLSISILKISIFNRYPYGCGLIIGLRKLRLRKLSEAKFPLELAGPGISRSWN